jgi:hypothetical protein
MTYPFHKHLRTQKSSTHVSFFTYTLNTYTRSHVQPFLAHKKSAAMAPYYMGERNEKIIDTALNLQRFKTLPLT